MKKKIVDYFGKEIELETEGEVNGFRTGDTFFAFIEDRDKGEKLIVEGFEYRENDFKAVWVKFLNKDEWGHYFNNMDDNIKLVKKNKRLVIVYNGKEVGEVIRKDNEPEIELTTEGSLWNFKVKISLG